MELIGKTPINPFLFYTGKISGYIIWFICILSIFNILTINTNELFVNSELAFLLFMLGLVMTILSLIDLGKSIRIGLPVSKTQLKTSGIYSLSRNPMYVGVNLFTLASMIYLMNWLVLIIGIYSLFAYHLIIRSEEKFLLNRFGEEYQTYLKKVRRFI
jgi:protein-S-isoprenylcysteine O-methyltransferase Ste14